MARINFDDDVESKSEFWKLITHHNGDRLRALGELVVLFRLCQEYYKHDENITRGLLVEKDLEHMIKCGWVVETDNSYQVKNPDKHFSWLKQKIDAGRRGGLKSNEGKRAAAAADRPLASANPLAPSLAPSLIHKKEVVLKKLSTNEKLSPTLVANMILQRVAKYGIPNATEARKSLGEDIWSVVKQYGGWARICNTANQGNVTNLCAQLREFASHI